MYVVHQHCLCRHKVLSHFVICLLVITSQAADQGKQTSDIDFNNITDVRLDQNFFGFRNQSMVNKTIFEGVESKGSSMHVVKETSTERPTLPSEHVETGSSRSPRDERSKVSGSPVTESQTAEIGINKKPSFAPGIVRRGTNDNGLVLHCDELRNFTEMFSVCDSSENLDSHHSCRGRCGQVLTFDEAFETCSCDVNCLAYNDCCVDFSLQWADLFTHSQVLKSSYSFSYCNNHFKNGKYRAIFSCVSDIKSTTPGTSIFTVWSSTHASIPITSPSFVTSTESKPTGLQHYSTRNTFVADLTSGLVYTDLKVYECNAHADSRPYFLPYVLPLTGPYVVGESIESYVFPHSPHFYHDPYILRVDPLLRACFNDETIQCLDCHESNVKVTLLCQVLRTQQSLNTAELFYYAPGKEMLNRYGSCTQFAPGQMSTNYWSAQRMYTVDYVSPSPSSWIAARRQYEETVKKLGAVVTIRQSSFTSSEYILEFEGAPWKTIQCSHPSMSLDDCDITECSRGHFSIPEQRCIQPTTIEVHVETKELKERDGGRKMVRQALPVCLCFAVYTAIKNTQIWNLGELHWNDSACIYEIMNVLSSDDKASAAEKTIFQEVFKHIFPQHQSVCKEQYHSIIISTCFKHHNIIGSRCFTFAFQEISTTTQMDGDPTVNVPAASSGSPSRGLNGIFAVVTLTLLYQHCAHFIKL